MISDSTRLKLSIAQKNRFARSPISQETRNKIGEANRGHTVSNETRNKISNSNKGRGHSLEWKLKQSEKLKGKKVLDYSFEVLSQMRSGANHPLYGTHRTDETKNKIRLKKIGQKHKEISKQKIIDYLVGGIWYGNVRYNDNPYCEKWTPNLRERVRAYFGYVCFECGVKQDGRKLCVHHIHYNKKTCCDGSPHDMVPLCQECHTRTNYNRDYWEEHFVTKLYEQSSDGKCFFTKEEMKTFNKLSIQ
jgi:hypothetical protein